jgi:hypothetical protein
MKISTEDHFKDIILYFQIFMAAFAMGSYQLLPRLMEMDAFSGRIPRAQTILFNHLENDLLRP